MVLMGAAGQQGAGAGSALMRGKAPKPTPFTVPKGESRALSKETEQLTQEQAEQHRAT
jgi:hypothetical protein